MPIRNVTNMVDYYPQFRYSKNTVVFDFENNTASPRNKIPQNYFNPVPDQNIYTGGIINAMASGDPWEMQLKFMFYTTGTYGTIITYYPSDGVSHFILIQKHGTKIRFYTDIEGNYDIEEECGFPLNAPFWIKLVYLGINDPEPKYILYTSADGETFTQRAQKVTRVLFTVSEIYPYLDLFWIPRNPNGMWPSNGILYLDDCYFKLNDTIIWTPSTIGQKAVNLNKYF